LTNDIEAEGINTLEDSARDMGIGGKGKRKKEKSKDCIATGT